MSIEIRAWPREKEEADTQKRKNNFQWWFRIKVKKTDNAKANVSMYGMDLIFEGDDMYRYVLWLIQFSHCTFAWIRFLLNNTEWSAISMCISNYVFVHCE